MSDTATIIEPTISDAKAWCLEARQYLGLSRQASKQEKKHAKGVASDLKSRAGDVAKELEKIQKALNSTKKNAKSPISQEQYRAYETQFKSVGKALLAAGKSHKEGEIERLSDLLDGLKLEIVAKLAKKGKKTTRAEGKRSDRQEANITAAKALLKGLTDHAEAKGIEEDVTKIKANLKLATGHNDSEEYDEARTILTAIGKDCAAATAKANAIAVERTNFDAGYVETEEWVTYLESLPGDQKNLIKDEVKTVKNKLKAAGQLADKFKFTEANAAVGESWAAGEAAQQKVEAYRKFKADLPDYKTRHVDFFNGKDGPTKEIIKKELKAINDTYRQAVAAGKVGKYQEGNAFLVKLDAASTAAKDLIEAHDLYDKDREKAQKCLDRLLAHPKAADPAVAKMASKVTTLMAEAAALAKKNKFADATAKCATAQKTVNSAEYLAAKTFGLEAIKQAKSALSEINKHKYKNIIEGEMKGVAIRLKDAEKAAKKRDYYSVDSDSPLADIALFVARSKKFLAAHDAFVPDLKAKQELFAALKELDKQAILTKDSGRIQAKLDLAEVKAKGLDHDWANSLLKEVEGDCAAAKAFLESHLSGAAAQTEASGLIAKLAENPDAAVKAVQALLDKCKSGTPPKAVTDRVGAIQTAITKAGKAAKGGKDDAQGALEQACKDCAEIGLIAERHLRYLAKVTALTPDIQELKDHAGHEAIAKRLVDIAKKLTSAEAAAQEGKHGDAMDQLGEVVNICAEAKTKADLALKLKPEDLDETALTELATKPGGDRLLDELIDSLGEKPSRRVLKAAMKARFGVELDLPGKTDEKMAKGSKSVKKLYDLLRNVPQSHTKGNIKLQKIERYGDKTGSGSYLESAGRVKLECGRTGDGKEEKLCVTRELPDVEDDCKPQGGNPPVFSFTVLHEIGHAVDAKMAFMNRKGGDPDKGAWKSYGSDVSEIAKAGHTKTKYDEGAIKHYLKNKAWPDTEPTRTNTMTAREWAKAKREAEQWCKDIRNKLWWKGSLCKTVEVGDRVYQEAYDNDWVSYLLSARTKGITGYQFRAPGEWFAELYAAYHSGSLRSGHPAMSWLQEVSPPKPGS